MSASTKHGVRRRLRGSRGHLRERLRDEDRHARKIVGRACRRSASHAERTRPPLPRRLAPTAGSRAIPRRGRPSRIRGPPARAMPRNDAVGTSVDAARRRVEEGGGGGRTARRPPSRYQDGGGHISTDIWRRAPARAGIARRRPARPGGGRMKRGGGHRENRSGRSGFRAHGSPTGRARGGGLARGGRVVGDHVENYVENHTRCVENHTRCVENHTRCVENLTLC